MGWFFAGLIVVLILAMIVRATTRPVRASRDAAVIDMIELRGSQEHDAARAVKDMRIGPGDASPFMEGQRMLPTGPPPCPSCPPKPARAVPGPQPPWSVGSMLELGNAGPPTYTPAADAAYCP